MVDEESILSTQQAADELGVTAHYVRVLCQEGRLACFKLSREWLVKRSSLEAFKATRRSRGRPPKQDE
jgi:excisionase family DNA binding protein